MMSAQKVTTGQYYKYMLNSKGCYRSKLYKDALASIVIESYYHKVVMLLQSLIKDVVVVLLVIEYSYKPNQRVFSLSWQLEFCVII